MISLKRFKEIMGSESENYSDQELQKILSSQDQVAEVFYDMWLREVENDEK